MSEEKELPKVGEWWWYGYCINGYSRLKKCRILCVGKELAGVEFDDGKQDSEPLEFFIARCVGDDVPGAVSREQQKPWWRFW